MRKALRQYQAVNLESDIDSASPYRITQLLLEGCLRFLRQARIAIEKKDFEKKSYFISKAEAIIATLAGSLSREFDESLADNLSDLYDFSIRELVDASVTMDVDKVDSVIQILTEIKAGWDAIPSSEVQRAEIMRGAR